MRNYCISVVIPAYRAAGTIARAVGSALGQSRKPDEILVIDDGSPDDLAGALAPFGSAVTLVRQPNGGAASARNTGIGRASGEWIAFLDSDDYWEPDKLEKQLAVVERHPEVGVVSCRWYEEVPGAPRTLAGVPAESWSDESWFDRLISASGAEAFHVAMCMWTCGVLVRRALLAEHRFQSGLEPAEDRDLWIRLATASPVYLLAEPLATYVQEPGSLSRSDVDRDCGNMLRVVHRHAKLLGPRAARQQEAIVFLRWAAGHLARGNPRAAVRPALHRLKLQPYRLQAWWIVCKSLAGALRPASRVRLAAGKRPGS